MPDASEELPLEAPQGVLEQLCALLPPFVVTMRRSGISSPVVPSIAVAVLRDALASGTLIDRSNGDSPLQEWDGWLVVDTSPPTYLETRHRKPPPPPEQ